MHSDTSTTCISRAPARSRFSKRWFPGHTSKESTGKVGYLTRRPRSAARLESRSSSSIPLGTRQRGFSTTIRQGPGMSNPGRVETTIDFEALVQHFEGDVFNQRPVEAEHYDDEYFVSDWREGDNRYDI